MKKVLLVYEDYGESSRFQTVLKKVGFDVIFLNNLNSLSTELLTFNPDAVVACGKQKFSSMLVGKKLKDSTHFKGKVILIMPQNERPQPKDLALARVDILIEAPVQVEVLLQMLAKIGNLDPQALLEKYKKMHIGDGPQQSGHVMIKSGGDSPNNSAPQTVRGEAPIAPVVFSINDHERVSKYQNFMNDIHIDTKLTSHGKQAIKERQAELEKGWDFDLIENLNQLKKAFAQALFKKK